MIGLRRNLAIAQTAIELIEDELARRTVMNFTARTKPDFEPARHHLMIAALLDRVLMGLIKFLYIGMPPRHGKSELCTIRFIALWLALHPNKQVILVCHNAGLAVEFSRKIRALLRDDVVFRRLFPAIMLDPERARVDDWKLIQGGGLMAVGAGGGLIGHGADLLVIDDPMKEGDAESDTVLDDLYTWYVTGPRTRLNAGGAVVFVMQRWHPLDLIGRILALSATDPHSDQWTELILPAICGTYDDERGVWVGGMDSMGRMPGEALWPERYPTPALMAIRAASPSQFEPLYQQNAQGKTSHLFPPGCFGVFTPSLIVASHVWTADLAITEDERNDYSAFGKWRYDRETGHVYLYDCFRVREEVPALKGRIVKLLDDNPRDSIALPAQTYELVVMQLILAERPDLRTRIHSVQMPLKSKYVNALVHADRAATKRLNIASDARDRAAFISEHEKFPFDGHDDYVDMASVAAHHFELHKEFAALIAARPAEKEHDSTFNDAARRGGF